MRQSSLFLLLATLALISCGKTPTPTAEPIRPVKVIKVVAQERQSELVLAGEVRARYESPLAFRVAGKVVERLVNLGDQVKKDQPIARVEATDFNLTSESKNAAVADAKVTLSLAETEYRRYQSLQKKGAISESELDQKRALVDGAKARLKAAESVLAETARQIGYTTLAADVDGLITRLDFNVGQVVALGQVVIVIARDDVREIEVHIPEADLGRVQSAAGFKIIVNAVPGEIFNGKLRELSASADSATRSYAARVTIQDPNGKLSLGMSASVSDVRSKSDLVLRLPLSAITSLDGHPMVWKLDTATSTLHAAKVRPAALDGNGVIIEDGIQAGETIVTAGANLVREGQQVKVLQ